VNAARKTRFVSVNLTEAARDALQQATTDFTSPARRRITLSDLLIAAINVSRNHPGELVSELQNPTSTTTRTDTP
jgi:hypothetical protein